MSSRAYLNFNTPGDAMQFLEGARNQTLSLEDSSASAWLCVARGLVVAGALLLSTNGRASRFCFEFIVYS